MQQCYWPMQCFHNSNKSKHTKKSLTCEEDGAQLRTSFWHLLMNLKNKYLKYCWSRPIKNEIILIFTMLQIFLKIKKNTWRYHHFTCVPKIMITWCTVPKIWCAADRQTDGHTGGPTEKVTYWGGYPIWKYKLS